MKTDVISIYSNMEGTAEAMRQCELFCMYHHLPAKSAMHLRLLTEESISMVHGILSGFKGEFWLESEPTDKGLLCRICVSADATVNEGQENELLAVSTSGKNEDAKGIMGKIRQIFRWSIQQNGSGVYDQNTVVDTWYMMGTHGNSLLYSEAAYWSLEQYRKNVNTAGQKNEEERDELEKSIVAKIADEVKVGIRSGKAEVLIEKTIEM